MNEINELILKLSGSAELEKELTLGKDYQITLSGQIVKVEDLDNQNGTSNKKFVFKPYMVIDIN